MRLNITHGIILSVMLLAVCNLNAAPAKNAKKNLRPAVAVIQKDGKKFSRRCFRDADNNGFCDRGSEQKGKCKNNCRKADVIDRKSPAAPEVPKAQILNTPAQNDTTAKPKCCACCPFAGNCANGCQALLKQVTPKQ